MLTSSHICAVCILKANLMRHLPSSGHQYAAILHHVSINDFNVPETSFLSPRHDIAAFGLGMPSQSHIHTFLNDKMNLTIISTFMWVADFIMQTENPSQDFQSALLYSYN